MRAANQPAPEPSDPYLCVKLVAEPLRILLALEGRFVDDRDAALALGTTVAPALGGEIEAARTLLRNLHRSPAAPLQETLPTLVALSRLIAQRIAAELPAGESVLLVGGTEAESRVRSQTGAASSSRGCPDPPSTSTMQIRRALPPSAGSRRRSTRRRSSRCTRASCCWSPRPRPINGGRAAPGRYRRPLPTPSRLR